ncbi:MAG: hypothetical protein CMK60_04120 [Proteobacteria bacterium]|jgi:hypothetical protein|nr:hypothetical protein [Pseudomonadota bacterium]|tara:strand:+ start:2250 stop:3161 length:912 start_codon:yes stop_codon:yes gene_type:complete
MQASVFEPMDRTVAETVLKETKRVLDQLGIVFFLRHGTCLGAVRDDSLITWDDDLDVGSVIGLHGLTEERMYQAVELFSREGFAPNVIVSEIGLEVEMKKFDVPIDWNCYRIIGDNIYQWPVVQIPLSMHTELKEIKFLGETFLVPNPPEDYLRQRYGPDWEIPKKIGTFESDVLEMTDHSFIPPDHRKTMSLGSRFVSSSHTGYLKVLDLDGLPVHEAQIGIAATAALTGLENARTNIDGRVFFNLPVEGSYVVSIAYNDHREVLYSEWLAPHLNYVYTSNPAVPSGRRNALTNETGKPDST